MEFKRRSLGVFEIMTPKAQAGERLDTEALKGLMDETIKRGVKNICLDFSDFTNLDRETLTALQYLNKTVLQSTGRLTILSSNAAATENLDNLGLSSVLRIYQSEDEISADSKEILRQTESYYIGNIRQADEPALDKKATGVPKNDFDNLKEELGNLISFDSPSQEKSGVLSRKIFETDAEESSILETVKEKVQEFQPAPKPAPKSETLPPSKPVQTVQSTPARAAVPVADKVHIVKPVRRDDPEDEEDEKSFAVSASKGKPAPADSEESISVTAAPKVRRYRDDIDEVPKKTKSRFPLVLGIALPTLVVVGLLAYFLGLFGKADDVEVKRPVKYAKAVSEPEKAVEAVAVEKEAVPEPKPVESGVNKEPPHAAPPPARPVVPFRPTAAPAPSNKPATAPVPPPVAKTPAPVAPAPAAPVAAAPVKPVPKTTVAEDDLAFEDILEEDSAPPPSATKPGVAKPAAVPAPAQPAPAAAPVVAAPVPPTPAQPAPVESTPQAAPANSSVFISSSPPTAEILEDGKIIGIANRQPVTLSVGNHHLVLRKGSMQAEVDVEVAASKNKPLFIKLK